MISFPQFSLTDKNAFSKLLSAVVKKLSAVVEKKKEELSLAKIEGAWSPEAARTAFSTETNCR